MITITKIPEWTYDGIKPSVHTFFAAITLANLDDVCIRISAEDQRSLLGYPVFGKKEIKISGGLVRCYHMKSFGQDCDVTEHSSNNIMEYVNNKRKILC